MNGSDPPAINRLHSLGHLIVNVAGLEHRPGLLFPVLGRQATGDSILAVTENFAVGSAHSKCPFVGCLLFLTNVFQPIFTGISSFLIFQAK
jgi:hypothetical protein